MEYTPKYLLKTWKRSTNQQNLGYPQINQYRQYIVLPFKRFAGIRNSLAQQFLVPLWWRSSSELPPVDIESRYYLDSKWKLIILRLVNHLKPNQETFDIFPPSATHPTPAGHRPPGGRPGEHPNGCCWSPKRWCFRIKDPKKHWKNIQNIPKETPKYPKIHLCENPPKLLKMIPESTKRTTLASPEPPTCWMAAVQSLGHSLLAVWTLGTNMFEILGNQFLILGEQQLSG